jgi:peptide deformylase
MEITKVPEKILKKKVALVSPEDLEKGVYKALFDDMRMAMKEHNGVGLAANQIGQDLSIFIIDPELAKENELLSDVFVNPEITEYSKDEDELEEGCLSIPQYYAPIKRAKKIKIKALNDKGEKVKFKARGFLARVLQHETDHLNGTVIKDRADKK